ncbi:F-type H+-transporting ATPase subunit epsilon [Humitalea rosea]|uniref:F-type H+-transporting ATPase subunit epsilon n=1 Tax=Humitalea rosea TaxID=990373 RepID=A0A2W7HXY2_9PROT|nr:F0F1 ATP synthase subunit epsilon [Humitalea rosea]PZW39334.1 F-type H+-transporting ATPase subunit epsilon [Humitalea rosea]
MKLLLTDPVHVLAEHDDVVSLRAADASGGFGIRPGHADLLTVLSVSVVSWRHQDGHTGCCAVRGGILTVRGGKEIAIATREGQLGDSPEALETTVLATFLAAAETERTERVAATRMQMSAVREIVRILRSSQGRSVLSP